MANLVITGLAFKESRTLVAIPVSEAVAAFDFLRVDDADPTKFKLASALSAEAAAATHIALAAGAAGDYVAAHTLEPGQELIITATGGLVVAEQYVASTTPGKIAPRIDLVATNWLNLILLGKAADNGLVNNLAAGLQI